jgi:hypothetical protein
LKLFCREVNAQRVGEHYGWLLFVRGPFGDFIKGVAKAQRSGKTLLARLTKPKVHNTRIKTVLINSTSVFQMGNGAQVFAEDIVNHPTACTCFFGNGNRSVGVAAQLPHLRKVSTDVIFLLYLLPCLHVRKSKQFYN